MNSLACKPCVPILSLRSMRNTITIQKSIWMQTKTGSGKAVDNPADRKP